jgi:small subunit ribosomal protein S11
MIDGVPYNKLHIVYINATKNNTLISFTDHAGLCLYSLTAGSCGFKNSKKSTAIAGQAAGLAISDVKQIINKHKN